MYTWKFLYYSDKGRKKAYSSGILTHAAFWFFRQIIGQLWYLCNCTQFNHILGRLLFLRSSNQVLDRCLNCLPRSALWRTFNISRGRNTKIYNYRSVGAASQWWSNERMMVHFKLMMVKYSIMMVKWVYDHIFISPSLTSISQSLTSSSPSLADWTLPPSLVKESP
jgi:hypothetical protein